MSNVVLAGQYSYQINSDGTIRIIAPEVNNLSGAATSGPVRLELWVTSDPWNPGVSRGYKIGVVTLNGGEALTAGQKILNLDQTVSYTKPPAGSYFVTLAVTEYTGKDLSIDNGYVIDSAKDFSHTLNFTSDGSARAVAMPAVTLTSKSVWEGDSGTTQMAFTLTLSEPSKLATKVQFDTYDQTAVDGVDYKGVHQTVSFAAGSTTATVYVPIYGNEQFEPNRVFGARLSQPVNGNTSASTSKDTGYIYDDDPGSIKLPTDTFTQLEWYLYTTRTIQAWSKATGKGVKVAVLDNGIDAKHPDLAANMLNDLGRNAVTLTAGGSPVNDSDTHGTLVAGVIAAARNGTGAVGVAYDAKLVSLYGASKYGENLQIEIANAYQYAKSFDVLNDSWGYNNLLKSDTNWAFYDNANDPIFAPAFKALRELAAEGRHGLGTVVVQSAGNSYDYGDDTNLHNFQNSRYIITVGATDYHGGSSNFSTTGASILVAAPGGAGLTDYSSIITTDRTGTSGLNNSDFAFANGTSLSAPLVSGIVALMMEVNPKLGYRDVQQILAYTAHQTDSGAGAVHANGATDWNGGGLQFIYEAQTTGFGQVDALAAVRLAQSWDSTPKTVANTLEVISKQTVDLAIPDASKKGLSSTIDITSDMVVERVDISVNITHSFIGDLKIALTSPSGTTSYLMSRPSQGSLSSIGSSQQDVHFTFDTVLNWGEVATGKWTLNVVDVMPVNTGKLGDWTLDLIGHAATKDDTYVYTYDYTSLVKADPTRGILSDTDGGNNTINTSALSNNNYLDLSGATPSVLNGGQLTIAAGTTIRNAFGGDGNDTIIANAVGSTLHGMGGNDILRGGAGLDTAAFLHARADYTVTKTADGYQVKDTKGDEGNDQLTGIERLQFSDSVLALDAGTGIAGQAYRLYQAAFNRTPDAGGLGYWIGAMDKGTALIDVAKGFVSSAEFQSLYGVSPSNAELVTHLYSNVLHRAPDAGGAAYWLGLLDSHAIDAAEALRNFSESAENVAALVGATQNGITFTPFIG
jgi:subtilisin-like proprotein convertase family protein/subtilisin family serine protease